MSDIASIKRSLESKASEFEANKEMYAERIMEGFETARKRLERAEKELLKKLELFFGSNVFSEQLAELDAGTQGSLEKATAVASLPVPADFGPDEEAFGRLYKEISRLADKTSLQPTTPPPPPGNLAVQGLGKNGFYDGVTLSWTAVTPEVARRVDCVKYKVQMVSESKIVHVYDNAGTSCVFQNLRPKTTYSFCARCIWDDVSGPWSDPVEFTTSPIPVAMNVKCTEAKECEATIAWDPVPVEVIWEVEFRKNDPCSDFKKGFVGGGSSCTLKRLKCETEYLVRVRARLGEDDKCGEWSEEIKVETKKWTCSWVICPSNIRSECAYIVRGETNNIAEKVGESDQFEEGLRGSYRVTSYSYIIGTNPIPVGTTVSWNVKITKVDSYGTYAGIKFLDNTQNSHPDANTIYIDCHDHRINCGSQSLYFLSGIMETFKVLRDRNYINSWIDRQNIRVVVDTKKGEISFGIESIVLGTVRKIPLDKPLVPYVKLEEKGSTAELIID